MLAELRIRNIALIDDLTVRLGPGLNVLTGETGAGKSIVVGALALLLGERATSEAVREGADRATVEGVFEVGGTADFGRWLEDHGIEPDDGLLILKREVAVEGRNRAWINGSPVTASLLGEIGGGLVSIHGQHSQQTLLRRDEQRAILDAFSGHEDLLGKVRQAHLASTELESQIRDLERRRREVIQRSDFLRFQVDEIEAAAVQPEEEERLAEEAQRLAHADELIALANRLSELVNAGEESACGRLSSARRALDQLVQIDESQHELTELLDTAYYAAEELGGRLETFLTLVDHDPVRLEEIGRRQDQLFRLRSKYGPTLVDVLRTLEEARGELALLEDAEWELSGLARRRDEAAEVLAERAGALTTSRAAAAQSLAREVGAVLPDLGMEGGRFEVVLIPLDSTGVHGSEEIEFRVSLNRGFDPKPLAHVASGGELARVMLALKTILARVDAIPTLIFDEVDAGIGGRVALHVGEKMREVAASHQVLAITHLPQIASRAHRHLHVRKDDAAERTATSVRTLDEDERVAEIARMLGGDPESAASLAHASELLDKGRSVSAVVA